MLQAAIEAGGTKFVLAIGKAGEKPVREERIPTTKPEETLQKSLDFFLKAREDGLEFDALGIGSFGPIDPDPSSATWGFVTDTPKPYWANTDMAGFLARKLAVPVAFDTDVNTAALAESRNGAGKGLDPVLYLTIGTGIGGGLVVNNSMVHGLVHPEMGHMYLKRRSDDTWPGRCPFHGDCAEGLASGPAVEDRWQERGEKLPPNHPAWDLEAWYIGQMVVNLQMTLSAQAIILGGGVMDVPGIRSKIRQYAYELSNKYLVRPRSQEDWNKLILAPLLDKPGLQGAFIIACEQAIAAR
jgi:fructokinase